MTISSNVSVVLDSTFFALRQAYVALSRIKKICPITSAIIVSNNVRSLYGLQPLLQSNAVHIEPTRSRIHPKTIQPSPCTITDGDILVRVNLSSTDSLKEVTVNKMECIFRLAMLFATNRAQFQQFIDNESTIQLLIQRLYSLPVPYFTQRSGGLQSKPGGHKRCTLLQVQKAHDWLELLCRVHKRGYLDLGPIETHSRARAKREVRSVFLSYTVVNTQWEC